MQKVFLTDVGTEREEVKKDWNVDIKHQKVE